MRMLLLNELKQLTITIFFSYRGIALAARLKALGIESIMAERNDSAGDNWALRYDCLRFHIPTAVCDPPFMRQS